MTVVSVSELTGPILVTDAKTWIRFYELSSLMHQSAHDPGVKYKLNTLTTNGLYYYLIY